MSSVYTQDAFSGQTWIPSSARGEVVLFLLIGIVIVDITPVGLCPTAGGNTIKTCFEPIAGRGLTRWVIRYRMRVRRITAKVSRFGLERPTLDQDGRCAVVSRK